jgi:hypothetical protein
MTHTLFNQVQLPKQSEFELDIEILHKTQKI